MPEYLSPHSARLLLSGGIQFEPDGVSGRGRYTTKNPSEAEVIEASSSFQTGLIVRVEPPPPEPEVEPEEVVDVPPPEPEVVVDEPRHRKGRRP